MAQVQSVGKDPVSKFAVSVQSYYRLAHRTTMATFELTGLNRLQDIFKDNARLRKPILDPTWRQLAEPERVA